MTLQSLIFPACILTHVKAETQQDVIRQLYQVLLKENKVCDSFYDAVIQREQEYPTGLVLEKYNVAIPHVVPQHVRNSALGIAVLEKPVAFRCMDDPNATVDVKVVFNIALGKDGKQIEVLQQLMEMVMNPYIMEQIVNAESAENIADILRKEDV